MFVFACVFMCVFYVLKRHGTGELHLHLLSVKNKLYTNAQPMSVYLRTQTFALCLSPHRN